MLAGLAPTAASAGAAALGSNALRRRAPGRPASVYVFDDAPTGVKMRFWLLPSGRSPVVPWANMRSWPSGAGMALVAVRGAISCVVVRR